MSAGMMRGVAEPVPSRDLSLLAPLFRDRVDAAIAECNAKGLDAYVYEGLRSEELQALYYARGRTQIPPNYTVTNAKSALYSWHGFGLAVDVISRTMKWSAPLQWFRDVAAIFKKHGLDWGGDWKRVDLPHFQFGTLRISPSDRARQLLKEGGLNAVWREVGAIGAASAIVKKPRILSLGTSGPDVAAIQFALGAPATGEFDKITDAWVRGFQRGKGLAVDGDVGDATHRALAA